MALDAGPDAALDGSPGACGCSATSPVYQFGECVPPLELGCDAVPCTPSADDCGEGRTCDPCGAAACCWCQACVPACVRTGPAQGPLPEYLKISPPYGPAHQAIDLYIEGFPFYVGALFYTARVGPSAALPQSNGSTCSFMVQVPGQAAGTVPVWASQYGGGGPWVLAGFFSWLDGDYPACIQPGMICGADFPCCATADVPMACVDGRCRAI